MNLMLTKVRKWGNSLALRIPQAFAVEAQRENDALVEISLVEGKIVIAPVSASTWALDDLLTGITPENLHTAVNSGRAVGNEA